MKYFLGLLLLASPLAGQAQGFAPGVVALGGSINYYGASGSGTSSSSSAMYPASTYRNSSTQRQFGIAPSVSYFVSQNLALGLGFGYFRSYLQQRTVSVDAPVVMEAVSTRSPAHTYSASVFGQYYKMLGEQFGLTMQLGAEYSHSGERGTTTDSQGRYQTSYTTIRGYYLNLTPGVIFFPSKRLGLSLTMGSLSYSHTWAESSSTMLESSGEISTSSSDSVMDSFMGRFGFNQLYLGGAYYFGR